MNVMVVSKSWPCDGRSGVSLIAAEHVTLIAELGYKVSIVGASPEVDQLNLPVYKKFYVRCYGSGSLYSPSFVQVSKLKQIVLENKTDLLVVQAWQTGLSESAIHVANVLRVPVLLVSHGISVHSFSKKIVDKMRALAWTYYRYYKLPRLIQQLASIACLDMSSTSDRFFDRELAIKYGIPVVELKNFPINVSLQDRSFEKTGYEICVVGYFSPVKNQIRCLELLSQLPDKFTMKFIGNRKGKYYKKCLSSVSRLNLHERVRFLEDSECSVADEIAKSLLVLSMSKTEVLPVTLLEAMAAGVPFIATPVGANGSLDCGFISNDLEEISEFVIQIADDESMWNAFSDKERANFLTRYTRAHALVSLQKAINIAITANAPCRRPLAL